MELTISLPEGTDRVRVAGAGERNLKIIREALGVKVAARDGTVRLSGSSQAVGQARQVLTKLTAAAREDRPMTRQEVLDTIASAGTMPAADGAPLREPDQPDDQTLDVYLPGRRIRAMTQGQERYIHAVRTHDLTFCTGPAGTGKTYLAVAAAVEMLKRSLVRKLVLVRPAVEAGEKLGFLPGDMQEKVNPYLRPLLDALHDMMEFEQVQRFIAADVVEIVPLAFMRGRTLNDAVVILDEAQNTTSAQMLMFLTRLGHGTKMIVTGDTSQIDLEDPQRCGLIDAARRLRRIGGIDLITLERTDIVRHRLVQKIVEAYGRESDAASHDGHAKADRPNDRARMADEDLET